MIFGTIPGLDLNLIRNENSRYLFLQQEKTERNSARLRRDFGTKGEGKHGG